MRRHLRSILGLGVVVTLALGAGGAAQRTLAADLAPVAGSRLALRATGLPITAPSYLLADLTSGQVLAERAADVSRPPASITKVMTALLALERGNLNDVVAVSERAARTAGTSAGLMSGQLLSLRTLLYGLLLESGNDAAVAIAEHLAGSEAEFALLMNERARELGARGTTFRTASGLDGRRRGEGGDHVATARDMGIFARRAMEYPLFREVVATPEYPLGGRTLHNLNYFLFAYPGATGIKNGWTPRAGNTLIVSARRGSVELLAVLLGSDGRDSLYNDAIALMDFGFQAYRYFPVVSAGTVVFPLWSSGQRRPLLLAAGRDGGAHLPIGTWPIRLEREIQVAPGVTPAAPGTAVGRLIISADGQVLDRVPLVVAPGQNLPDSGDRD